MKNHEVQMSPHPSGFVQIPKILFQDPIYSQMTAEAKLLYGLLKDRCALSMSKGDKWVDMNGNVFIYYTHAEIMDRFNCGSDKARSMMQELENAGLIKRTRQGLCKPYKLVVKSVVQRAENTDSVQPEIRNLNIAKTDVNKDLYNNSNLNYPESLSLNENVDKRVVKTLIKENICYDVLIDEMDLERLNLIVNIIVDTISTKSKTIKIAGEKRDTAEVCHSFMKLNDMHIRYVNDRINYESSTIYSLRGYILMHLYQADVAMDIFYGSLERNDYNKSIF